METGAQNPATTSAQQGDGTNSFLNRTHTIAIYIAFAAIWMAWGQWAYRQGMPVLPFWESFLQVTIADLAVITLHECGHTLCGVALGQKVLAFMAGPFQWRKHAGHWKFSFNLMGLLTTGGGTAVVPQQLGEPKWREFCMISAGPLVSFVTGIAGLWVLLKTQSSSLESLWFPLAMFGSISLVTAIANLIPLRTSTGFSDGARIYQLLRGGPWADLHEVYKITAATTVTSLRPRDYNIKAIHRVFAAGIVTGPAELLLHLLARSYYLDIGRPGEADLQLNEAEKIYDECAEQISPNLLPSFVVGESLMRRDAARARLWWDRMEAKRPTWLNGDYWMARSALCVVEGNLDEGWAAWAKAQEYLRSMPEAGTYAFDRELLEVLKRAIETESSTTSRVSMA
jgi:Zn-dependent protease